VGTTQTQKRNAEGLSTQWGENVIGGVWRCVWEEGKPRLGKEGENSLQYRARGTDTEKSNGGAGLKGGEGAGKGGEEGNRPEKELRDNNNSQVRGGRVEKKMSWLGRMTEKKWKHITSFEIARSEVRKKTGKGGKDSSLYVRGR